MLSLLNICVIVNNSHENTTPYNFCGCLPQAHCLIVDSVKERWLNQALDSVCIWYELLTVSVTDQGTNRVIAFNHEFKADLVSWQSKTPQASSSAYHNHCLYV